MSTELAVLEVSEKNYPKIYCVGGLDAFYQKAKAEVEGEVPDLSTGKGRDRIAKLAADVSRSKGAVEKPGRAYNKFLKAQPKLIDKELREYCDKMDQLRDDTRAPLTAWEAIDKAEKKQVADTAAYLIKFAADLEEGYRDNELVDLKAKQAEVERQAEITKAANEAKAKAEAAAADEIEESRLDKIAADGRAEFARQAAKNAEWLVYISEAYTHNDKLIADKNKLIAKQAAEWLAYLNEAYAHNDQLIAAKSARDAVLRSQREEDERIKRELESKAADKKHTRGVKTKAMNDFIAFGVDPVNAKLAVQALAAGEIAGQELKY